MLLCCQTEVVLFIKVRMIFASLYLLVKNYIQVAWYGVEFILLTTARIQKNAPFQSQKLIYAPILDIKMYF